MSQYITYPILIDKLNKLDMIKNDYDKLGNSVFKLDEFICFPSNIILLLQNDLLFFRQLIEFYNNKFTTYINKYEGKTIDVDNIDTLFDCINKINTPTKLNYVNFTKEIIPWLKTTEFFNEIINNKIKITEDELMKIKELKKEELNNSEKFIWRPNQIDAINRLNKNGLERGVHCQATGTGKSYIILKYIEYMKTIKPNPKIILFTERINILADLFHFKKGKLIQDNETLQKIKEKGICDITDFNIIDRVTNKKKDWDTKLKEFNRPTLLVINRAFLTLGEKNYIKILLEMILI
jgi:hypothetical protein